MGAIIEVGERTFRDFETDGVAASGKHLVKKSEAREFARTIENAIANAGLGGLVTVLKATAADLAADLAHAADTIALVYADPDDEQIDLWKKSGAPGGGAWANTGAFHATVSGLANPYVSAIADLLAGSDLDAAALVAEFAGGAEGGFYIVDRQHCFTDVNATTPVTATGQTVRCIKNALGDSDWDLVQVNAGTAGVYFEAYGVGFVRGVNGKAYASRANVQFKVPSFIAAAVSFAGTLGRGVFGLVKNTGTRHLLQTATLARMNATCYGDAADLNRPLKDAYSTDFSAPIGPVTVFHSLLSAGKIDSYFEDSTAKPGLEEVVTAWANNDTVNGMSLVLNCGSQSLGNGVPNADASFDFYGGVVISGHTPGNRAAIIRWLQCRSRPTITADDEVHVFFGDSTGDDVGSYSNEGLAVQEMVQLYAKDVLPSRRPDRCVLLRDWVRKADTFQGYQRFSDGNLLKRTFVINCSSAGSQPGYFFAERYEKAVAWLPKMDLAVINHGQNLVVGDSTIVASAGRKYLRAGQYMDVQEQLRTAFPGARHMMVDPYPRGIPGDTAVDPAHDSVAYVVAKYGDIAKIGLYARFDGAGRPLTWYEGDHVHPTVPTGVAEMLDEFTDTFDAMPAEVTPTPALLQHRRILPTENLLANGSFETWAAGLPTSWALAGDATVSKVGARALVTAEDGGLQQTINATPLQGQVVTLYLRQEIVGGSQLYAGGVRFSCNGGAGANIGDGRWVDFPYQVWDAERGFIYQFPVPATATTLTVQILGGITTDEVSGEGSTHIARAVLVAGEDPRDIVA